jgi:hypothetical protein
LSLSTPAEFVLGHLTVERALLLNGSGSTGLLRFPLSVPTFQILAVVPGGKPEMGGSAVGAGALAGGAALHGLRRSLS